MVQIHVAPEVNIINFEDGPSEEQLLQKLTLLKQLQEEIEEATASRAIHMEKVIHEQREKDRMETFQKILDNSCTEFNSIWPLLTSFASVIFSILAIGVYTMIPVHNVVEYPEKWFEYPIQCLFSFWPIYATHIMFDSVYFLNVDIIRSIRTAASLYLAVIGVLWMLFPSGYMIWTQICGFRYPIPLIGYVNYFTCTATCLTAIWFQFPPAWRNNSKFRLRLVWNVLSIGVMNLAVAEYIGMSAALISIPKDYQWAIAIMLPFIRHFNVWLICLMAKRCQCGDPSGGKIYITQVLYNAHAYFVAYSIGTATTLTTSTVIIAGDFIINVITSLRMVYLQNKEDNRHSLNERINLLQELVISELTETLTPLTYLACLLLAYYGPNSETIGNVKNSWFHFIAIEDFAYTIKFILVFFFVDLGSLVISAGVLWKFCSINFYKAFSALQTEFGIAFGQNLAILVVAYFGFNLTASATDFTFEFDWIDGDFNLTNPDVRIQTLQA